MTDHEVWLTFSRLAEAAGSPPEFAALASSPALRAAVIAAYPAVRRLVHELQDLEVAATENWRSSWNIIRRAAEDIAVHHRVFMDRLRGTVAVLAVEGSWWNALAPGVLLCSRGAWEDAATCRVVVRHARSSRA